MTVTFLLRARCPQCGCWCRGIEVRQMRVLVRSMRSTDRLGLGAVDRTCPECRSPTAEQWELYLDPRDEAKVEAARAKLRARRPATAKQLADKGSR